MSLYEELIWRDLIKDVSDADKAKELLDGENVRFYCGFDPTGKSLTIGHLVQVIRMRLLQLHGHIPVVLIGGATGLIGDPRQTGERKLLPLEESLENARLIKEQISKFLDPEKTIFVNNYDWIKEIDMISFLRDYGKFFNVNYMLAKDNVQSRLDTGISFTEFSYMLIQAIDWLHLYKELNVEIQFGGSDQWGNITTGLELIRKSIGENSAVGMSSPLLLKSDGEKFGKSESGAIWVDKELTSPYEVYQYFLNTNDLDVSRYLRTLTLLSKEEILKLEDSVKTEPEKRIAQRRLAEEVVIFMHGKEALDEAVLVTEALFTGDFSNLTLESFKTLEKVLDKAYINDNEQLVKALVDSNLAKSNREAREFINNNAISLNGNKIDDDKYLVTKEIAYFNKYVIAKRGRRRNSLLVIE